LTDAEERVRELLVGEMHDVSRATTAPTRLATRFLQQSDVCAQSVVHRAPARRAQLKVVRFDHVTHRWQWQRRVRWMWMDVAERLIADELSTDVARNFVVDRDHVASVFRRGRTSLLDARSSNELRFTLDLTNPRAVDVALRLVRIEALLLVWLRSSWLALHRRFPVVVRKRKSQLALALSLSRRAL
jgi:hypothetical protein